MSNNSKQKDAKKIFRFKLSDRINEELALFTNANRYNERNEIKTAWKEWCNSNDILIADELIRLVNLGYSGDLKKKLWFSVRYYHMKKENKTIDGVVDGTDISNTNDDKTTKRRKYITIDKSFLALIDKHINEQIKHDTFTPAKSYKMFIDTYGDDINCAGRALFESIGLKQNDFYHKLKKTYKNRYQLL